MELRQVGQELGFNNLNVIEDSVFKDIRTRQLDAYKDIIERNRKLKL